MSNHEARCPCSKCYVEAFAGKGVTDPYDGPTPDELPWASDREADEAAGGAS